MNILLVDDDSFVRSLLRKHLEEEGHSIHEESNVDSAIQTLETGNFQLLVTDIIMPSRDGGQLMQFVRAKGFNIPIIAITGGMENAQEDYKHYAEFFADETIIKPVAKEILMQSVNRLTETVYQYA